jgi:hypothetical protein
MMDGWVLERQTGDAGMNSAIEISKRISAN